MKVTFCITELDPGGAERALQQIVLVLQREGVEVTVVALSGPGVVGEELLQAGIPVTYLHSCCGWDVRVLWKLRNYFRHECPDIVQTFLFHANIAGRIAARWAGVPIVNSGIRVAEKRSPWYLRLDRWTEHLVDQHICVSQSVLDYSVSVGGLSRGKCTVIPNGVDFDRFANAAPISKSELGISEESNCLLFVGRLDPQKRPGLILEALRQEFLSPNVHAVFVGEGPLKEKLEGECKTLSLSDRVHFLGRREDVPQLMKMADVLVLTSLWEGMPNVVLEAMASGLPVVATEAEGIQELLAPPARGFLIENDSPEAVAKGIQKVLKEPHIFQPAAETAQNHTAEHLTWDSAAERYLRLYRDQIDSEANPLDSSVSGALGKVDS
ncbi:glycosyltransferase [Calycomorphotria hydatis]|uniref:GalNAc-alpha-(1->4)-GalNAc-alpha-(1->3)-diNAcBac-PP-undecaprenol alpha-1,4-N-acetyl-D-galactosaminyltransferase n=1 Tax=Calycomorphotria hydatis TaxID=2528027 RepID=A0A517T9G0_9PLAN|nr:glycosyltransferase [Calycomorphotria hydatis]QDT64989.1 GalNAc-alpha-(1->4)-GalNAc-alpha-(1->3)-diNAcBac-PP-undecaprenol alpha-1,4-N-acetyl-D-galactosaminyltransferase [Calycomorphotria hydatis]